jgi:hypothetical protein
VRRAAVLVVSAAVLAGCGGGGSSGASVTAVSPGVAKKLMVQRLRSKHLDYTWLACIALPRTYQSVKITRCNVGFGVDPHVEAYCVVMRDGKLVSNHEDATIPCRHDDVGIGDSTITTS